MQAALRALLVGYAPLTDLVATRVYWNAIPQDAIDPCVVLYRVAGAPGHHTQGSDHLDDATVQIDVRTKAAASGDTAVKQMWAIRDSIIDCLDGYRGQKQQTLFRGIFLRSQRQTSEKPGTVLYHRCSLDFEVWSGNA